MTAPAVAPKVSTVETTQITKNAAAFSRIKSIYFMRLARMCGAIDGALTEENLPGCDLILVAIRPRGAIDWVTAHAPRIAPSAIVVDLCGVKRTVVEGISPVAAQYGFSYIGGHPMPLTLRVAIKPTPSICVPQRTVSLSRMEPEELVIRGRHDPCIAHRAVPVVEAVTAAVLLDLLLEGNPNGTF